MSSISACACACASACSSTSDIATNDKEQEYTLKSDIFTNYKSDLEKYNLNKNLINLKISEIINNMNLIITNIDSYYILYNINEKNLEKEPYNIEFLMNKLELISIPSICKNYEFIHNQLNIIINNINYYYSNELSIKFIDDLLSYSKNLIQICIDCKYIEEDDELD